MQTPLILALESSCDDTSAAVLRGSVVLSNVVANQAIHEAYGGVVPELASRAHQEHIIPVVQAALNQASVSLADIDALAFTQGPGLMGSLMVGVSFMKSLALSLDKPLIAVNHLHGHVLAHCIADANQSPIVFPFLCLLVSGGHTQIIAVHAPLQMELLGQTQDDAVGECYDKIAKMLGFPYPGGPHIDRLAQTGNPLAFSFPCSDMPELNYSFSGLKTAVLYFLQKQSADFIAENLADICASVQHTIVKMLLTKLKKAVKQTGIKTLALSGGVAANSGLRSALQEEGAKNKWQVHIPKFSYCTDNAAMIGIVAKFLYEKGNFATQNCLPQARMAIDIHL